MLKKAALLLFVILLLTSCVPGDDSITPAPALISSPVRTVTLLAEATLSSPLPYQHQEVLVTSSAPCGTQECPATPTQEFIPDDLPSLHITYICNDGFIIATAEKKILIDALFHDSQDICQTDSDESAQSAQPPFDNADLVLVSHSHWDHFNSLVVGNYLQNNPKAILIAEKSAVDAVKKEFGSFDLVADRVYSVELARGQKTQLSLAGVNVEIINTPADVPNVGFLFQLGKFTFFHSGDSGFDLETVADFQACQLPEKGIDFAFVPYWYLTDPLDRSILEEGIHADNYIPMHYAGDYTGESPAQIFSVVTRYFPQAILFPEEMQTWSYPPR